MIKVPLFLLAMLALGACTAAPMDSTYTTPEANGLKAKRPYPYSFDVCQIIEENDASRRYMHDNYLLIGCPSNEGGAIQDHIRTGARIVGRVNRWTLLGVPR